jgi:hypothetical protein
MKNKLTTILIAFLFLISCKDMKNEEIHKNDNITDSIVQKEVQKSKNENVECLDKDSLQYQDSKITVYNEFKMRGSGIISLTINDKVTILNEDNTIFGDIASMEESDYSINLPKKIVARSFVPVFDSFYFDAEKPNDKEDFLKVYINKEIKKIKKNQVEYSFENWADYVKKSFIKLRDCNASNSKQKDNNTYEVIQMIGDSIKVKSISKKSCDVIEYYKDVTKKIKWKSNQNVLLINFFSCD